MHVTCILNEAAANVSTTKPTLTMKPDTTSHKHQPTPHSSSHVYDMHPLCQAPPGRQTASGRLVGQPRALASEAVRPDRSPFLDMGSQAGDASADTRACMDLGFDLMPSSAFHDEMEQSFPEVAATFNGLCSLCAFRDTFGSSRVIRYYCNCFNCFIFSCFKCLC